MPDHRPPIFLEGLLDDPDEVRRMMERHTPYAPVQRYLANEAQARMARGNAADHGSAMFIAPNFRGDWAFHGQVEEGAERFLHHPKLVAAAQQLFDSPFVRPQMVFTNVTWQLPFPQGSGHTDVPAFRGFDRTVYPTWILAGMGASGLFEEERIQIATAVAWFYRGSDGGLDYWPEGPDAPPVAHEGRIFNTAIMGDNDRMFHRVRPVGDPAKGLPQGLTLDSRLVHRGGEAWAIEEAGETVAEMPFDELRISLSWKGEVFRDEAERDRVDGHAADLRLEEVLARFAADFRKRGEDYAPESLDDPRFTEIVARLYPREPSVQAA